MKIKKKPPQKVVGSYLWKVGFRSYPIARVFPVEGFPDFFVFEHPQRLGDWMGIHGPSGYTVVMGAPNKSYAMTIMENAVLEPFFILNGKPVFNEKVSDYINFIWRTQPEKIPGIHSWLKSNSKNQTVSPGKGKLLLKKRKPKK